VPRSEEGSGTRIVRNSLLSGLGSFSGVLITLFLTPLMIDRLGASGYGVWILATSLTFSLGYLSFAELGIEASAVRFIAEARGAGDRERASAVLSTSLALFLGLALVLTPIVVLLAGPIAGIFSIPDDLSDDAALTFTIVAATLAFDLPTRAFSAVTQGAQRYGLWQVVEVSQVAITAVTFAVVLLTGGGMVELAIASLAIAAAMLVTNIVAARIAAPETRASPRRASMAIVKEIGTYGGQVILFRLGGLVYRQTDKTIIGILLSAALVTTWEIAFKIQAAAAMIESVAASALIPAVAFNRTNLARTRELLVRGTAYAMALSLPVVVAAFVFADPLIRTWIGDGFDDAVGPTRLFLGVLLFSSIVTIGQALMTGLGRMRGMLILMAISIVLNLTLSIALAKPLGVEGVILGTLISQGIMAIPLLRLFFTELEVPATEFLRRVVLPLIPAAAAEVAVALPLLGVAERSDSLLIVALLGLPGVLVFGLVYLFVGLRPRERRLLIQTARSTVGAGA
jgi:O-antigen/teichoic acid export membrane protein